MGHRSTDTHGNGNPERWTFHVPGTQWYEMQRLNEHWSYVDLEGEFEVREALMGISLLHYMASGDNYPQWINEFEGVRYPPPSAKTRICTPTVLNMRKSRTQLRCPRRTPAGTLLRLLPSRVLSVG